MAESTQGPLDAVSLFLVQVVIIILLTRLLGFILKRVYQPQVIAEILGGILLGPTALGNIPGFSNAIFPASSLGTLGVVANMGLIFFMFLIGLELDPRLFLKRWKSSLIISLSAVGLPFVCGIVISFYLRTTIPEDTSYVSFILFIGISMSITAFPVLARILAESGLINKKIGLLTLSAAAVNDLIGWILLAFCVSIAASTSTLGALWTILETLAFAAGMGILGRVTLHFAQKYGDLSRLPPAMVTATFVLLFISSFLTELIGIHALFGAFVLGVVFPKNTMTLAHEFIEKIEGMVFNWLLPLYFVNSGLKTDLKQLNNSTAGISFALIMIAACFGKIAGGTFSARLSGQTNWREALTLGILMNTRGLVELIILNIGLDLKILTPSIFAAMVLMAITTTFMTSPLLRVIYPPKRIAQLEREKGLATATGNFNVVLCMSEIQQPMLTFAQSLTSYYKTDSSVNIIEMVDISRMSDYARELMEESTLKVKLMERCKVLKMDVGFRTLLTSQDPSEQIQTIAKDLNASLLVLGGNKSLFAQGTLGGPTFSHMMRSTQCSVSILVDKGSGWTYNRVLVPYTGTTDNLVGKSALKIARLIGKLKGTEVHILKINQKDPSEVSVRVDGDDENLIGGGRLSIEQDYPVTHMDPTDPDVVKLRKKGSRAFKFFQTTSTSPAKTLLDLEGVKFRNYNLIIFGFSLEDAEKAEPHESHAPHGILQNMLSRSTHFLGNIEEQIDKQLNLNDLRLGIVNGFDHVDMVKDSPVSILYVKDHPSTETVIAKKKKQHKLRTLFKKTKTELPQTSDPVTSDTTLTSRTMTQESTRENSSENSPRESYENSRESPRGEVTTAMPDEVPNFLRISRSVNPESPKSILRSSRPSESSPDFKRSENTVDFLRNSRTIENSPRRGSTSSSANRSRAGSKIPEFEQELEVVESKFKEDLDRDAQQREDATRENFVEDSEDSVESEESVESSDESVESKESMQKV
eukprot:TRINITY_DN7233_c0_g1_i2.p1 TRINITY_DN7233_c0_g1~~TRINITY_DN7233_c0_g1_i2.p1  ORF type:complete len:982 (-),score=331.14 TRINITY_DN7233_c0_g1_i2:11-2956(-)